MKLRTLSAFVALAMVACTLTPSFANEPDPTPHPTTAPTMSPPITVVNTNTNTNTNTNVANGGQGGQGGKGGDASACSGIANCSPTAIANGGNASQHQGQGQTQSANNALNNSIATILSTQNNYTPALNSPAIGDCSNGAVSVAGYANNQQGGQPFGYANQGVQLGLSIPVGPKPASCKPDVFKTIMACAGLIQAGITLDPKVYPAEVKACSGVHIAVAK